MTLLLAWDKNGWDDYLWWQQHDKKVVKRINILIADALGDLHRGIGKPKALNYDHAGYWSRHITQEHRLVYRVKERLLIIAQCRYHY